MIVNVYEIPSIEIGQYFIEICRPLIEIKQSFMELRWSPIEISQYLMELFTQLNYVHNGYFVQVIISIRMVSFVW